MLQRKALPGQPGVFFFSPSWILYLLFICLFIYYLLYVYSLPEQSWSFLIKNGLVRLFNEHLTQRSTRSCSGMFSFSPFAFTRFSFDSCCSFICDVALVARDALLWRSSASVIFFLGECASFRLLSISSRLLLSFSLSLPTLCFILKRHEWSFRGYFLI